MSKRLSWLDNFAEEQNKKIASIKKTERVIVDVDTIKNAKNGENVKMDNVNYKVVNASFEDESGKGILLEKSLCPECNKDECECKKSKIAMVAQEYARTDPGNVYHIEVRDTVEQQKFQDAAMETEQAIAMEDSIDGTSGATRPNRILEKAKAIMTPVFEETEEVAPEAEENVEETEEVAPEAEENVEEEAVPEAEETVEAEGEEIEMEAKKIASAIEAEIEAILEETEKAVKDTVPAKYIKSTLASLEKTIEAEGILPLFDKRVSRDMLRKTAGQEVGESKIKELIAQLTEAVVAEVEDVLKDADEVCDEKVEKCGSKSKVEETLKSKIESLMTEKGINFKLARVLVAEESMEDKEEVEDLGAIKKSLEKALKAIDVMIGKEKE